MEDIVAYAGTLILGIGAVATFIAGKKYKIAKDLVKTLNDILEAAKDGKITKEESKKIIADIKAVIANFKK